MLYSSGEQIEVGDTVLIEQGKTEGVVSNIIKSASEQKKCNVNEPGIMLESKPFGLVFWPTSLTTDPAILKCKK